MEFYKKSYELASWAHNGQFLKDGQLYITHIDAVIVITRKLWSGEIKNDKVQEIKKHLLANFPATEERILELLLSVANFHDCRYEDQKEKFDKHPEKLEELIKVSYNEKFYQEFDLAVRAISKLEKGKEEYTDYINRVRSNEFSYIIKISDLLHNISHLKPGNLRDKYHLSLSVLNDFIPLR